MAVIRNSLASLLLVSLASMVSLAGTAWGQTYEDALFKAGYGLTGAIGRKGLSMGKSVGIAKFRDRIGVVCEPMASMLTSKLRTSLIGHVKEMGFSVNIVESLDPAMVDAVVSGEWFNAGDGKVMLSIKMGDVKSLEFADLGMVEVSFVRDSLSPAARKCLLDFEPLDREIEIDRPLIVRESPTPVGKRIDRIKGKSMVWVSAKVISQGAEDWFVVRLPDDDEMPVGMRERRGFVYGLSHHPGLRAMVKLEQMEGTFVAERTVRLRVHPTATAEQVAKVPVGTMIQVTGKVLEMDWFRVDWENGEAYVHGPSLKEVDEREIAAWNALTECDARATREFLEDWPGGHFAQEAARAMQRCEPPLEVKIWTEKKTYRAGENIKIFVKGNKDFHARVVYRDAEGNLVQLLPNKYRQAQRFVAGRTYAIPNDKDEFDLEVGPPFGSENVLVFASTVPLPEMAGDDIGRGLMLLRDGLSELQTRMRGVTAVPREGESTEGERDVEREFHEAASDLKTRP
jgi:hypothetical protein